MLMSGVNRLYSPIGAENLSAWTFVTHVSTTEQIGKLGKLINVKAKAAKQKGSVLSKQNFDFITIKCAKA